MTAGHWERTRRALVARAERQAAVPVADWPAPRGRRGPDGRWSWTLALRPEDDCSGNLEAAAVTQLRACASRVQAARQAQGLTLRQLAQRTDIALSALTGLEQGSAWPSFAVLGDTADALGHRLQIRDAAVDFDWPLAEAAWRDRGRVAAGWHQIVVYQLLGHFSATGLSAREVALRTGLARETVTELRNYNPPTSWASTRVLFALTACYRTGLDLVQQDDPWPTLQIERWDRVRTARHAD